MKEQEWRQQRDDRTLRYAQRCLDSERWIAITAAPEYLRSYEGQVALLTTANLLGRMTPAVALSLVDVEVDGRLPWRGRSLADIALSGMIAADPFGRFCERAVRPTDYRIHLGRSGNDLVVHGKGWNAFVGSGPSPISESEDINPFGAALSAILAVSQLFVDDLRPFRGRTILNAFTWRNELLDYRVGDLPTDIGSVLFAGVGSVGTAALYFLALAGCAFQPTLIDMDVVKIHNLDRSPLFIDTDVGSPKVESAQRFLRGIGIAAKTDRAPLHESPLWVERPSGSPDVLIAAANEMGARYQIESRYPPVQLYGTTGRNWQCSLIRHIPIVDPCSCCLFPPEIPQPTMACATAPQHSDDQLDTVDAALPFLSFAAGLMTTAEVLKLGMDGYPFSANRVTLSTRPSARCVPAGIPSRLECICGHRSEKVHRQMLQGGKYAFLTPQEFGLGAPLRK